MITWCAVGNAGHLRQETQLAVDIYKSYGRWGSVCSAVACWAIVAAL